MSSKKSEEVIGKLGKVADSLESATTQLSGIVTQQQLDVVRERISKCESDLSGLRADTEIAAQSREETLEDFDDRASALSSQLSGLERDFSGMRALVLSSFSLSVICLVGFIFCIVKI